MITLDQLRCEGLEALRERLRRAGMVWFLSQFDNGRGDYARERREWVDRTSLEELRHAAGAKPRRRKS